jgi:hypothetical protein
MEFDPNFTYVRVDVRELEDLEIKCTPSSYRQ